MDGPVYRAIVYFSLISHVLWNAVISNPRENHLTGVVRVTHGQKIAPLETDDSG